MPAISSRAPVVLFTWIAALTLGRCFAIDEGTIAERLALDRLGELASRIESGKKQLTPKEREELLLYALTPKLSANHAKALLFVHALSSTKSDTAGTEVIPHAEKIETCLHSASDIELWQRYAGSLVFAFEDQERGDDLEEKWFKLIVEAAPERQSAFFEVLGSTKWALPERRLKRLAVVYNSAKLSQRAREHIVDVVYAGMSSSQVELARGCLFYRDLTTSQWTSPALNVHMFDRLADLAVLAKVNDN